MFTTRRQFIARSAVGGAALAAIPLLPTGSAVAAAAGEQAIVAPVSRFHRFSPTGERLASTLWVIADLGERRRIQAVRFRPADGRTAAPIDIAWSDDPTFTAGHPIARWRVDDGRALAHFAQPPVMARYVRIESETADRASAAMRMIGMLDILSDGRTLSVALKSMADIHCPFPCVSA